MIQNMRVSIIPNHFQPQQNNWASGVEMIQKFEVLITPEERVNYYPFYHASVSLKTE